MADTVQPPSSDNNRPPSGTTVVSDPEAQANGRNKRKRTLNFDGLQINVYYFRSVPGILKIIEWVIGIICIACASPPQLGAAHWFIFVAVFCFIFTFIWACIHLFSLTSVINAPWLLIEMGYTALAMLFYFIAFIVMLVETAKQRGLIYYQPWQYHGYNYDAYLAAGSFGVFNFIAYAIETLYYAKVFLDSRRTATTQ